MKEFKLQKKVSGNCECAYCKKRQEGLKPHPYTVWWKESTEKRGHNEPVCSIECGQMYITSKKHEGE